MTTFTSNKRQLHACRTCHQREQSHPRRRYRRRCRHDDYDRLGRARHDLNRLSHALGTSDHQRHHADGAHAQLQ